jgi:hypothetical protein
VISRVLSAHQISAVPCPNCGAHRNKPCKFTRIERGIHAHRERQWAASDKRLHNEAKRAALEVRSSPRRTRDHCLADVGRVFGALMNPFESAGSGVTCGSMQRNQAGGLDLHRLTLRERLRNL